jgi:hypothetical protein
VPALSGNFYYHITGFDKIPPLTSITISFRGTTGNVAVVAPPITIKTYFDAAQRIATPSDAANINDFYRSVLPGIDITGPYRFPNKLEFAPFLDISVQARVFRVIYFF